MASKRIIIALSGVYLGIGVVIGVMSGFLAVLGNESPLQGIWWGLVWPYTLYKLVN